MFNTRLFITQKNFKKIRFFSTPNFIFLGPRPQIQVYKVTSLDVFFTGKTYKWLYKKHSWRFLFNRAHVTYLFFKNPIIIQKQAKAKVRIFFNLTQDATTIRSYLYKIRRYNIFTQRGIKVKGSIFFKKRGKISTYRTCLIFELFFLHQLLYYHY